MKRAEGNRAQRLRRHGPRAGCGQAATAAWRALWPLKTLRGDKGRGEGGQRGEGSGVKSEEENEEGREGERRRRAALREAMRCEAGARRRQRVSQSLTRGRRPRIRSKPPELNRKVERPVWANAIPRPSEPDQFQHSKNSVTLRSQTRQHSKKMRAQGRGKRRHDSGSSVGVEASRSTTHNLYQRPRREQRRMQSTALGLAAVSSSAAFRHSEERAAE